MKDINTILLIGYGSIGKRHLANLRALHPEAKIVVMRSRPGEHIDGCELIFDIESAIKLRPDVAFICNPSSFHIGMASVLHDAGIHLFIEKPLSNSMDGVESFMSRVESSSTKVMVGYNLRYEPVVSKLKALVSDTYLGKVLYVSASVGHYLPDWRPGTDYRQGVSARSELGGGALLELSHEIDYLQWIFGSAHKAYGRVSKVSDLEIDVDDLVLANLLLRSDAGDVQCTLQLDFLQRKPNRVCRVVCERGTLVCDLVHRKIEIHDADGIKLIPVEEVDRNFTYQKEINDFFSCIDKDTSSPISIKEGVNVLKVVDALRLSSNLGKEVEI